MGNTAGNTAKAQHSAAATHTGLFATVFLALTANSSVADSNDTGFAATTHATRREGGKLCVLNHMHGGSGTAGTQSVALIGAIKVYVTTTTDEYGSDWASWSKGGSKRISYTKSGDTWEARVEARPCK